MVWCICKFCFCFFFFFNSVLGKKNCFAFTFIFWYICCYVTSVVSNSVRHHRRQPTRLPRPWDSPGKNTGVCCHFLLQCMKVKSESEVTQSCLTFCNPMDCSPPDFSVHGILQARILEWVDMPSSRESSWLRESNPRLLHHRQILYPLSHVGSPNCVYINI